MTKKVKVTVHQPQEFAENDSRSEEQKRADRFTWYPGDVEVDEDEG